MSIIVDDDVVLPDGKEIVRIGYAKKGDIVFVSPPLYGKAEWEWKSEEPSAFPMMILGVKKK